MVVLPRDGQSLGDARAEMLALIDRPTSVVLVARGDDERTRAFVDRAESRVASGPDRHVVWLLNLEVLTAGQEADWFADVDGDPVIGAVLNDSSGRCGRILKKRPSRLSIEIEGFLVCEKVLGQN